MSVIDETKPQDQERQVPFLLSEGLFAIYKGKEGATNVVALKGLSLQFDKGEFVSVVGTSGAGKSTLLRILGGLQYPSAGHVTYEGINISSLSEEQLVGFRRNTVGFIFQEGNLLEAYSGYQNVYNTLRFSGKSRNEAKERATEILSQLGLQSRMHALPKKLSGGERQRVAIARALANKPKIIFADEPTGSLDYENTENVMGIFKDLHKEVQTGFFIVTHSSHVASFGDRTLELGDGQFVGQHASTADIYALADTREVIIDTSGRLTLPPEMSVLIANFGTLWNFSVDNSDSNLPKIVGVPVIGAQRAQSYTNCPVCKVAVSLGDFRCNSCGANFA